MGEGRSADLQVRQTGRPLLGAAARVGADPGGPVAVGVGVPRLLHIVPGRQLPGMGKRTGGLTLTRDITFFNHTFIFTRFFRFT